MLHNVLTLTWLSKPIPALFQDTYNTYKQSQRYVANKIRFSLIKESLSMALIVTVILTGGFNTLDHVIRLHLLGPIHTGLLYIGSVGLLSSIVSLPFSVYYSFVLEKKHGFSTITATTFILDYIKGITITCVIGLPILAVSLWFFEQWETTAWLWVWLSVTIIQISLLFIAPVIILPLFNRFDPITDKTLHEKILTYCQQHQFSVHGIYQMDGSKRSRHTNAFFTGLGRFKRIVLYDTLINSHTHDELLAIIAHEMGHYKHRHCLKQGLVRLFHMGMLLFLLQTVLNNPAVFAVFNMDTISVYGSFIFFGFLIPPLELLMNCLYNTMSRTHEYQADHYAIHTLSSPDALRSGLEKITIDNLGNLTPHPLTVWLNYSHPPIVDRLTAIISQCQKK